MTGMSSSAYISASSLPPTRFWPRKTPYSLSFSPRFRASVRKWMLCCLEPVKYWRAAPYDSRATERTSTWIPPSMITVAFVSPTPRTCFTYRQFHDLLECTRTVLRDDQDIQVADGFAPPAKRSGHVGMLDELNLAQLGKKVFRERQSDPDQHSLLAGTPTGRCRV